jgi:Zn-dependent protease
MATSSNAWSLFGIPIRVEASWFAIAAFLAWSLSSRYFPSQLPGLSLSTYWLMGSAAALLLFACIVLHELGHSLVARRHGIRVSCVTLFMFGGVAQITDAPSRPSVELKVALAGPLVSVAIAFACARGAGALSVSGDGTLRLSAEVLHYLASINIGVAVFNLLPGFPLDGGRILRAILWAWTGSRTRSLRMASGLGAAFGTLLLALGVWVMAHGAWVGGLWYLFLGMFLRGAALASYRQAGRSGA